MADDDGVEEIAEIAKLAVRIRKFLDYTASSYSFFIYSLGVIGSVFTAGGIGELLGVSVATAGTIGMLIGVLVSSYLHAKIVSKILVTIYEERREQVESKSKLYTIAMFIFAFIFLAGVSYLIGALYPKASNVAWYPSLALFLLIIYYMVRSDTVISHLIASIIMLILSPLVVYTSSIALALGTLLLAYLVAGLYGIYRALDELGG